MAGKTILVLGGGIGGITASINLKRRLGNEHRVIVLDKSKELRFCPSYPWLIMGWREPQEVVKDLSALTNRGIEYLNAAADTIDPENKKVSAAGRDIEYDYLITALGARLAPEALPGFSEGAFNLYELEGATAVRDALRDFSGGKIIILVSSMPYKCPGAPWETCLLVDSYCRQKGIRDRVELSVYTPEPQPMPVAGPAVGAEIKKMVEAQGISLNNGMKATTIDADQKQIGFENGDSVNYDLLIGIPPHTAPDVVKSSPLAGEVGWIPVDAGTLKTKFENTYAIGDVTAVKLVPEGMMLPKAGVFAESEAEVVAHNIAVEIRQSGHTKNFNGYGACFIEAGNGKAAYGSGNFYASPRPEISLKGPSRRWHWAKLMMERYWLRNW